jgi:CubicO group peptidase (beta-lactamase class C family)
MRWQRWNLISCFLVSACAEAAEVFPGDTWERGSPQEIGMDATKLNEARDYALTGDGSGYIVRSGKLVLSWGDPKALYDLKSTTKSFGSAALALAIKDGKVRLDDRAIRLHPNLGVPPETNRQTGWLEEITIFHLVTQTAGFEKPGGFTPLLFKQGTKWDYSDSGPNWLAECLTLAYRQDLDALMFERVFEPIGIRRTDLIWRKNQYRPDLLDGLKRREFGAGISANVDAMARFGYLHLRRGKWRDREILPADYIDAARVTQPNVKGLPVRNRKDYSDASNHYGFLWWNNNDATLADVPRDAYWSWGLYDSLIVVIPSLDIVVARAGRSWKRDPNAPHYDVLKPFLTPIAASVTPPTGRAKRPAEPLYPPIPIIEKIVWSPKETIMRKARGSDNWPMTWGDDDALYTAYGDGNGFEPHIREKLSLGLAKIDGAPPDFRGLNLHAPSIEQIGEGPKGRKASGILMVDSVLYLWVRNATNSQLAWSSDHGQTWTWSVWRFTNSFGCPTFLNFGKNYSGARDDYVYVYSPDTDSAYTPADRMVLARVRRDQIKQRETYEFFAGSPSDPKWSKALEDRAAVFSQPAKCYRSGITYHPTLKRYMWCQILPGKDTRFEGGFAIYDAPEPWGPWTTAFMTEHWDVGPGETCSIPPKWISSDGKTIHLVFSGDDCFSVRAATLVCHP